VGEVGKVLGQQERNETENKNVRQSEKAKGSDSAELAIIKRT